MANIEKIQVTLTSGSSGATATATTGVHIGRLVGIWAVPSLDSAPSANWDLQLTHADVAAGQTTAVDNIIFLDATTLATDITKYRPVELEHKAEDGDALSTRTPPLVAGPIVVTGANMGNSKVAEVWLFIEKP